MRAALSLSLLLCCAPVFAGGPVSEGRGADAVAPAAVPGVAGSVLAAPQGVSLDEQLALWSAPGAFDALDQAGVQAQLSRIETARAGLAADDARLPAFEQAAGAARRRLSAIQVEALGARLSAAKSRRQAELLIEQLKAVASSPDVEEPSRVAAAQALGRHLPRSFGLRHGRAVADGMLQIGLAARSVAVQKAVVEGLSGDLLAAGSAVAVKEPAREMQAIAAVAQASRNDEVKELAARAALALSDVGPRPALLRRLARFFASVRRRRGLAPAARTALGQIAVAGTPAGAPAAAATDGLSARGLRRAARWSRWRSLGVAATLAASAINLVGPLGGASAATALGLGLFVFLAGLARHRGLIGFAQALFLVGGAFASAATLATLTGPLGAFGLAVTVGYAALMAGIALWSFRAQRPWLGLLLNVLLLSIL